MVDLDMFGDNPPFVAELTQQSNNEDDDEEAAVPALSVSLTPSDAASEVLCPKHL